MVWGWCRVWAEPVGEAAGTAGQRKNEDKTRQGKTREDASRAEQASGYGKWTQSGRLQRTPVGLIQKCRGAIGISCGSGEQARLCQRRDAESGVQVGTGKERL